MRITWTPLRLFALGVAAIAVGVASGFLVVQAQRDDGTTPAAGPTTTSAVPPDVGEDLAEIETALNSGDPAQIAAILTREAAAGFDASTPPLPAGSTVDIEDESFAQTGEETGYVSADVAGPEPGRHLVLLWRQDDDWRVVATTPES